MYLVCGEALFDVFTGPGASGNRLNLEAVAGGSPYNVAIGLARLGVKAALLGGLSNDHFGQRLLGLLQKEGVDTGQLVIFDAPTTLAMVALGNDGAPVYSFRGDGCADRLLQRAVAAAARQRPRHPLRFLLAGGLAHRRDAAGTAAP